MGFCAYRTGIPYRAQEEPFSAQWVAEILHPIREPVRQTKLNRHPLKNAFL